MELLAAHNRKIEAQNKCVKYVPMKHSMKDVKAWERYSGKKWYSLKPNERDMANHEITKFLKAQQELSASTRGQTKRAPSTTSRRQNLKRKTAEITATKPTTVSGMTTRPKTKKLASGYTVNKKLKGGIKDTHPGMQTLVGEQSRHISHGSYLDSKVQLAKEEHDLLIAHNKKVRGKRGQKATYEPLKHKMIDVKKWERQSGRRYYDLNTEERENANKEITEILKRQSTESSILDRSSEDSEEDVMGSVIEEEGKISKSSAIQKEKKNRRRSSLLDISNHNLDPKLFNFDTPASRYVDIGSVATDGASLAQNDSWFQTCHMHLLVPPSATKEV